jgi:glycosyltransferase involved in cell wall biosynthesis
MNYPRISVLLPVFNAERYLRIAIDSILEQSFTDFEFIIIDDGSEDGSGKIIDDSISRDDRIQLIRRANTGYVRALQDGLEIARGDIIARMDADDIAARERFSKQLSFLDCNPHCVAVGSWVTFVDEDGSSLFQWQPPLHHESIDKECLAGHGGMIIHPAMMMRRAAFDQVGGYRNEFEYAEDFDLILRLAEIGKLANIADVLMQYRQSPKSVCGRFSEKQQSLIRKAIGEAAVRRGIPNQQLPGLPIPRALPIQRHYSNLAMGAILAGNMRPARLCAWRAIRISPLDWVSWATLMLTGPKWLSKSLLFVYHVTVACLCAMRGQSVARTPHFYG